MFYECLSEAKATSNLRASLILPRHSHADQNGHRYWMGAHASAHNIRYFENIELTHGKTIVSNDSDSVGDKCIKANVMITTESVIERGCMDMSFTYLKKDLDLFLPLEQRRNTL
jgi:hypothetical protein